MAPLSTSLLPVPPLGQSSEKSTLMKPIQVNLWDPEKHGWMGNGPNGAGDGRCPTHFRVLRPSARGGVSKRVREEGVGLLTVQGECELPWPGAMHGLPDWQQQSIT